MAPTTDPSWRSESPGELIAEDEGYEQIARGILDAVERGPSGVWRMPWHALQGGLPENAFTGRRFRSTNLLTLAAAARRKGFRSNLWAPRTQWEKRHGQLRHGETGTNILVPVFDESGPTKRWDAKTEGVRKRLGRFGGDPEGGVQRRILGFRNEPWFNVHQITGVDVRAAAKPTASETAARLNAVLDAWRRTPTGRRGPALLHGGLQAFWNPATDQIMLPPREAFDDFDGLSGEEFYAATNAHEHVHASGSRNRLNRESLRNYAMKSARAREELVAELGAAFLCGRFGLATALRPDHALYVESWMAGIGDRDRRKAFFWAVAAGERAADYILDQAGYDQPGYDKDHP